MESSSPTKTTQPFAMCDQDQEPSKNNIAKYKEIISTLPKLEGTHPSFDTYQYKGFWFPFIFLEAILQIQDNFQAQPTDIFLCSAPKTGATWLKALAFTIMTRDIESKENPLLTTTPHDSIPLLEADCIQNSNYKTMNYSSFSLTRPLNTQYPTPTSTELDSGFSTDQTRKQNTELSQNLELPLLATHIPYSCLPESILSSSSKIIYICREPKDTFISYLHFSKRIQENFGETISLEKNFDLFCEGKSGFGPYWDHVLEFWRASLVRPEKILFLKYEDVKADTIFYVKRLAEFMEKPFSMEEEINGAPEGIVEFCRFENLSSLEVNKSGIYRRPTPAGFKNNAFIRRGEVGDWKNHLTYDMQNIIDQITQHKLHGSGLSF